MNHLVRNASWMNQSMKGRSVGAVRRMGGGHGPPPTGWEAKVREVLPHDHQVWRLSFA